MTSSKSFDTSKDRFCHNCWQDFLNTSTWNVPHLVEKNGKDMAKLILTGDKIKIKTISVPLDADICIVALILLCNLSMMGINKTILNRFGLLT
jgi:hypothetical protein